jgi:hypothetical protein
LGYDELTDIEREFTHPRLVKAYLIEVEAEGKAMVAKATAKIQAKAAASKASAGKSLSSKQKKTNTSGGARKAASNITPSNQTGKKYSSAKAINK